jgi:hypothetical protein
MKYTASVALLLVSWGCGGSSSSPDGGTATRGATDGPVAASGCEHAVALCNKVAECAPFLLKAIYGDLTGCADRLTRACTEQATSNGSGMTRDKLLACETALSAATCNDLFGNNIPGCTFHGTFADGSPCGDNSQCTSGFCNTGGNLCGTCEGKQPAGAACASGSNDQCQSGLVCSSGKTCATPGVVGGACDDKTQPCLTGAFCTNAKTCALTVEAGEKCPGAYLNLGDGTFCTNKDAQSTQIETASAGQECGLSPGTGKSATLCAPGSVAACTPLNDSITLLGIPTHGMCADPVQDGFPCTVSSACLAGAQCIAGTCQIPSGKYCP